MDSARFDALTRTLTFGASRRMLAALIGMLGIALGVSSTEEAKAKKKPCPPCKKRKQGKCRKKLPDRTVCSGGTCQNGRCVPLGSGGGGRDPMPRPTATCGDGVNGTPTAVQKSEQVAQTFTATVSGTLVQAQLTVGRANNNGDFIVWIGQLDNNGNPVADGKEFAKTTVSDATLPETGLVRITATFTTSPVDVTQGTTYGLFLTREAAFEVVTHNEDKCPGNFYRYPITEIEFAEIAGVDMLFTASVA